MSTEVAKMTGIHFTVNVVMDGEKRLRSVHAGALEPAFADACGAAVDVATFEVPQAADVVLVSGGGYPLDATWYQSIKGLVAAAGVVRPGGVIIQATGLREGVGSPDFADLFDAMESLDTFRTAIREPGFYRREQWQLQLFARVAQRARVILYSHNATPAACAKWFVEPAPSVETAVNEALAAAGAGASLIVMPHGPYTIPLVRE